MIKLSRKMPSRNSATWILRLVLCASILVYTHGCGENQTLINLGGAACTDSTCLGNCTAAGECCLEKCFENNSLVKDPRMQNCSSKEPIKPVSQCESFENITRCVAGILNRTFDVCWRHLIYIIKSQTDVIPGSNPIVCPCELTTRRQVGRCRLSQCENNSTLCQNKHDAILNQDVCCMDNQILAKAEDCEKGEKFQESVREFLNISSLEECEDICKDGFCRQPNPNRLPACCRIIQQIPKKEEDKSLHGGVIAVIVIVIIVLIIVGALGLMYIYRIKQDEAHMIVKKKDEDKNIELTGIEEITDKEEGWVSDMGAGRKYQELLWNGHGTGSDGYTQMMDQPQARRQDILVRANSVDQLKNGDAHRGLDNDGYRDNESYDEEQSFETYRRRKQAISRDQREHEDNAQYVFDDGLGHSSEDDTHFA